MQEQIIKLPKITDPRGNLSFMQGGSQLPFEIKRCYWIYEVPGGECRYGRALKSTAEVIVALSGSFDVVVNDTAYSLNRSYMGLLVPPMHWREITNFSSSAVALVLASTIFDESDYIRSRSDFDTLTRSL